MLILSASSAWIFDLLDLTNTSKMFKNHLDMIGRNEPIQRKAKFWQSYVRSLKGTDDMRAPDPVHSRPRGIFRPLLSELPDLHTTTWPYKSIYDDPTAANERIHVPGYRYVPVSRETYGISPRNIYPPSYYDRYRTVKACLECDVDILVTCQGFFATLLAQLLPDPVWKKTAVSMPGPSDGVYKGQDAWDAQQRRLDEIDALFPDKYIPLFQYRPAARTLRGASAPPRAGSVPPLRARSSSPFARRSTSPPPPIRSWTPPPAPSEIEPRFTYAARIPEERTQLVHVFTVVLFVKTECMSQCLYVHCARTALTLSWHGVHAGQPLYNRGGWTRRPLRELLEPSPSMSKSAITRDPWWWEYPELRPYAYPYHYRPWHSPSYLRSSYLSPIKSTYLWDKHPRRPFGYLTYW
ncbi:hypothetical protein FOCC_FOCC012700 [Frankliniella occidentalis]|nr:hypothetical protein FOCC_FOCC012700 [Frankliniella occidentalis]